MAADKACKAVIILSIPRLKRRNFDSSGFSDPLISAPAVPKRQIRVPQKASYNSEKRMWPLLAISYYTDDGDKQAYTDATSVGRIPYGVLSSPGETMEPWMRDNRPLSNEHLKKIFLASPEIVPCK